MKPSFLIAIFGLLALTLVPAVVDGQYRFRWGEDVEAKEFAERLKSFPKQIGDWEAVSEVKFSKTTADQLQPIGVINRVYLNSANDKNAHVVILFGPTGPTAVHTPDICFSSREYRKIGERKAIGVGGANAKSKCFVSSFESRDVNSSYLNSWYAWTDDGTWVASEKPRFFFADERCLVKIQIASSYSQRDELDNDPIMKEFVMDIERYVSKLF